MDFHIEQKNLLFTIQADLFLLLKQTSHKQRILKTMNGSKHSRLCSIHCLQDMQGLVQVIDNKCSEHCQNYSVSYVTNILLHPQCNAIQCFKSRERKPPIDELRYSMLSILCREYKISLMKQLPTFFLHI